MHVAYEMPKVHEVLFLFAGEQQEAQEETDEVSLETLDAKSEKKEEEAVTPKKSEFSADRKDLCPPGLATRIHRMVLQSLIPQLHTTLTKKVFMADSSVFYFPAVVGQCRLHSLEFIVETRILEEMKIKNRGKIYFPWKKSRQAYFFFHKN